MPNKINKYLMTATGLNTAYTRNETNLNQTAKLL